MYTTGERDDSADDRYAYWASIPPDDGNLGNFWTKIRDKVIKPVGRVVAAYYTGGASEVAFKAYDASEAQKKAIAAQKAQMAQLEAMGNAYPPYAPATDPIGQRAYAYGAPPSPYPPSTPYGAPQGVYPQPGMPYNQGQAAPVMTAYPPSVSPTQALPSWAIPAGIGAAALFAILAAQRR
jgi:hypothetical protein